MLLIIIVLCLIFAINESCFITVFFRVLLNRKYFYGFLSVAKYCFRLLGNKAKSTDPCLQVFGYFAGRRA